MEIKGSIVEIKGSIIVTNNSWGKVIISLSR